MVLSELIFPKTFEPIAHTLAIIITSCVFVDAVFSTQYLKPLFFCYAIAGLYVLSVVYEFVHQTRRKRRSSDL